MSTQDITFRTRKWVKPEDLNANGTLFGGSPLRRIDESVPADPDRQGRPAPRGCAGITHDRDRIPASALPVAGERSV